MAKQPSTSLTKMMRDPASRRRARQIQYLRYQIITLDGIHFSVFDPQGDGVKSHVTSVHEAKHVVDQHRSERATLDDSMVVARIEEEEDRTVYYAPGDMYMVIAMGFGHAQIGDTIRYEPGDPGVGWFLTRVSPPSESPSVPAADIKRGAIWTCIRCPDHPYSWVSYLGRRPVKCPRCKSPYFDQEYTRPEMTGKLRAAWAKKKRRENQPQPPTE